MLAILRWALQVLMTLDPPHNKEQYLQLYLLLKAVYTQFPPKTRYLMYSLALYRIQSLDLNLL